MNQTTIRKANNTIRLTNRLIGLKRDLFMIIKDKKMVTYTMAALLLVSMVILAKEAARLVVSGRLSQDHSRVVGIDAGHGAADGGKVGVNDVLEKDINLAIALRVKELLEQQDVTVIMTREDDEGTYPKTGSNRKMRDMKKRVELINDERPALAVSIHQNAFSDQSVSGAQTFFYTGSKEGQFAAELLQAQMIKTLQPKKERVAKANDSYYLLKNTNYPIVIVECGFLTNPEEAVLLCEEEYQEKTAWAIHLGILQYLNAGGTGSDEMDENPH